MADIWLLAKQGWPKKLKTVAPIAGNNVLKVLLKNGITFIAGLITYLTKTTIYFVMRAQKLILIENVVGLDSYE